MDGGAAGVAAGAAGTAGAIFSVTDVTELVTPPNREEVSGKVSAEACVDEKVSQERAAAPARRTGRRARHGERSSPMRTTPSTVAFDDANSLKRNIAESPDSSTTNQQEMNIGAPPRKDSVYSRQVIDVWERSKR
ncbi:hypothetical protein ARTHROSP310_29060 [Arthrobacter sp. AD-310]